MEFPDAVSTDWRAGTVVEVAWGIKANHGGGYSYRICKRGENITEACFQRTPLAFDGDTSWIQFQSRSQRVPFRANRTSSGTHPAGSQWTKNPIPACNGADGGDFEPAGDLCAPPYAAGTQFPPPATGLNDSHLYGFGESAYTDPPDDVLAFHWSIVDRLQLPASLSPGDYVLSFRWDCEQTPQIWSTCANIRIE